jgi:DNA-binding beta-propeller fold protein YncE
MGVKGGNDRKINVVMLLGAEMGRPRSFAVAGGDIDRRRQGRFRREGSYMSVAHRIACALLIAGLVAALSAPAAPTESADPRGPISQWSGTNAPAESGRKAPAQLQPGEPDFEFLSGGYRSIHFNYYTTSSFTFPFQVTADNDMLFVSDASGDVVKMFQIVDGGVSFIRSFGSTGSGAGQFSGPEQVAVVGNDIYVVDFNNQRIERFNKTTGAYVSQFGSPGSGPGQLNGPSGLVYNPNNGFLYVSEVGNDRVQIFSTAGIYQGQFSSPGAGNGQLNNPYTLAIDSLGNIYAADTANGRVSKFDSSGAWIRHIAVGVVNPLGVAVDKANVVWVTSGSGDIYSYNAQGGFLSYYYGSGTTWFEGYFTNIRGIAVTPPLTVSPYNGAPAVVVADAGSQTVQFFSISAQPTAHPALAGITGVGGYNGGIAFDSSDNTYVTSFNTNEVYKYDKFGALITQWGASGTGNGQFSGPDGIAVDDSGNVFVADRNNNRIQKFDANGAYLLQFGSLGTGDGQFDHPNGLATDGAWLYVAEENNNRVQKFSLAGGYVRKWGTLGSGDGQFNVPVGIAVDRNRNQVYVSEYNGNRVQQFSVFGDFVKVFSGTTLSGPLGLATDQHGNLYCADLINNRVVQFNDNGTFLTNFTVNGANGVGVNPRTAQIYVGTTGGGVVNRFGAPIGKSDTIGLYRPASQTFLLRNANSPGAPYITATVALAASTDLPVTGDWNGDGIDTPGLYRPGTSTFYLWDKWSGLSIGTPDYVVVLGAAGDRPLVGDWDGDGRDGVGVYRPSTGTHYLKNTLRTGLVDYSVAFGIASDLGIAGDWNLDGVSSAGVFRASDARFHVTDRNTVGAVSEDGSFPLGSGGTDLPVVADWTHSGYSGLGVFRRSTGTFSLKYNLDSSPADLTVAFDSDPIFHDGFEQAAGDFPLGGMWGSAPE